MLTREQKQKAGHYEILGETLAKFELFEAGWNPYQRYLDVEKVDFILRKRKADKVVYREIQLKYGKLYDCIRAWEKPLFDISSWRPFKDEEFRLQANRKDFFLLYVLAQDSGYAQDMFVFPIQDFHDLLLKAVSTSGNKRSVWISRSVIEPNRWWFRIKAKFDKIASDTCIEVTKYRRNFDLLE